MQYPGNNELLKNALPLYIEKKRGGHVGAVLYIGPVSSPLLTKPCAPSTQLQNKIMRTRLQRLLFSRNTTIAGSYITKR
jgi:hypothetical protein